MRNILLIFYTTIGFVSVAVGQQYKFKFWDIRSKSFVTDIKVYLSFEVLLRNEGNSSITYDKNMKSFVYQNSTFGKPPKLTGQLFISSHNYCYSDSILEQKHLKIDLRNCANKPCLFNVISLSKIVFENSTNEIKVVSINLPFDCKTNSNQFTYHNKNTFISSSCNSIDSTSNFVFDLLPNELESFEFIPKGKINYVVSDTIQTHLLNGNMDLSLTTYRKVKIE